MPLLTRALQGAVARGELSAVFQPQVDLASGSVVGAEALCRWQHPELGSVPPTEFIRVAEDHGLIGEIGRFMAEQGCRARSRWSIDISVNVSPFQLETPDFTEWLADCLTTHRARGGSFTLEITESRAIIDVAPMLRRLAPLRAIGVGIALDDFGIGHSSITQLKRLHGTEVKLDRSLIWDGSPEAMARMTEVVQLAHSSGIRVVAEGVETAEHLDRARALGCDRAQGWLLGYPVPAEEFDRLIG